MTQFLPPNLLALFSPREPIPYLPPASKLPHEKKNGGYTGVGSFLKYFEVINYNILCFFQHLVDYIMSWIIIIFVCACVRACAYIHV